MITIFSNFLFNKAEKINGILKGGDGYFIALEDRPNQIL
jgi:hypothetical protein